MTCFISIFNFWGSFLHLGKTMNSVNLWMKVSGLMIPILLITFSSAGVLHCDNGPLDLILPCAIQFGKFLAH